MEISGGETMLEYHGPFRQWAQKTLFELERIAHTITTIMATKSMRSQTSQAKVSSALSKSSIDIKAMVKITCEIPRYIYIYI